MKMISSRLFKREASLIVFFVCTSFPTIAGKTTKSETKEADSKSMDPYMIMDRYEPCEEGNTIMRFENLHVDHNGAGKSIIAKFDLHIGEIMEAPLTFHVALGTKKDKKALTYIPFYNQKMDDICPKFEKEGTLKNVTEMMGFVNQTCPIQAGYYDRKNNKPFLIPPTVEKILLSANFWEIKVTPGGKTKAFSFGRK